MANKILIVDDEPFNLDLLEQELMDYDYRLERAGDGVEALEKIASFKPDVILLDYMMPRMNGLEVVRQLRANPEQKGIPVILLTAKATQDVRLLRAFGAGARDATA
jgi:CheY-like chemotaxis protein